MAEAWANHLKKDTIRACSAGVEIHGLNLDAVTVMAEAGVEMSGHRSKHVDEFKGAALDMVITVCDHAHETCPWFPASCRVIHAGFDDPPRLVKARGIRDREAQLDCYRRVRDEIKAFVLTLPQSIWG